MAKRRNTQRIYKIGVLVLLALIVLGFTIPGFIDPVNEEQNIYAEPRLCQHDADCYLICDDIPEKILCSQNLCVKNSCGESNYYPFEDNPVSFSLKVISGTDEIDLEENSDTKNIFITFEGNQVNLYSSGLSLRNVLDTLQVDAYSKQNILIEVNSEISFLDYVPIADDNVKITLS